MKKTIPIIILLSLIIYDSFRANGQKNDYSLSSQKNQWSHHYAFGSPSWDTFERYPNNPIYKGRTGMEWPVNGFLYADPVSKNWYLYVGEYKRNYDLDKDTTTKDMNCVILKSTDKGKNWNRIGDLFLKNNLEYDSVKIQVPDVMITYEAGKYHMIFDYVGSNFDWQKNVENSGIGYAVANSPEGPFIISKKPIKTNKEYKQKPLLGKYWRMYAPMIFKQAQRWAMAFMMDSSPLGSWLLAVSTATKPEGPYNNTKIIMNVEGKTNYAPLQEYFPAFTHKGYTYFPSTSVSINRNYQSLYRVKIDDMANADKYETFKSGSLWHSVKAENEYAGIWGQTFSGFVDDKDSLYVMYPSKTQDNYGTINLAKTSWGNIDRKKGFNFTANEGNSFTYIKKILDIKDLDMKFKLEGTMHLIWDSKVRLDIEDTWGKFTLNEIKGNYREIIIAKNNWKINECKTGIIKNSIDSGKIKNWNSSEIILQIKKSNGIIHLLINGFKCWEGKLENSPGVVGIGLEPNSYLFVEDFVINGQKRDGHITYGYNEALLSSGNHISNWNLKNDKMFINGKGAVSKKKLAFAKWNFDGKGFELFSPKGSQYGMINIYLDGKFLKKVSLKNANEIKSAIIFKSRDIKMGRHAVFIESLNGLLPLDCIKVRL